MADAPDLGSGSREWGFKSLHPQYIKVMYEELNSYMTLIFLYDIIVKTKIIYLIRSGYLEEEKTK